MRESKASQGLTAGTIIIKRTHAAALRVELVSECVYLYQPLCKRACPGMRFPDDLTLPLLITHPGISNAFFLPESNGISVATIINCKNFNPKCYFFNVRRSIAKII
jgi:hypothetical protein